MRFIFTLYCFLLLQLTISHSQPSLDSLKTVDIQTEAALKDYHDLVLGETFYEVPYKDLLDFYFFGLEKAKELQIDSFILHFNHYLGHAYSDMDSVPLALVHFNNAYSIAKQLDSRKNLYLIAVDLGGIYYNASEYQKSLKCYFDGLQFAKDVDENLSAYPLGSISEVYKKLDDIDNAIKYTHAANQFSLKLDFPEREYNLVYDYFSLSDYYKERGDADSAKIYLNLALEEGNKIDTIKTGSMNDALFELYDYAAKYYLEKNLFEAAANYVRLAESFATYINQLNLKILKAKYAISQGQFAQAKNLIDKMDSKLPIEKEAILKVKLNYFETTKDYAAALKISKELLKFDKEQLARNMEQSAEFANAEFESQQQKEQIKQLLHDKEVNELTIKNQNAYFIAAILLLILMLSVLFFYYYQNQQRKANTKKINILLEKLKQTNEELSNSNRDLEQFAYIASHDLQEPLRTIGNFVNLLEDENEDKLDEESKMYMEYVVDGVTRMSLLIDALLAYSKLGSSKTKLSSINPQTIIDNKIKDLSIKIKESGANIIVNNLPTSIKAEPNQFGIVIFNLINNGIKFNRSDVPTITIDCVTKPDHFLFSVKDNGIGIDPKNHNKIFEVFKRLHRKEVYKGTGIGLASVKRILTKHNGEVWLESELGKGTTFYFTIPKD